MMISLGVHYTTTALDREDNTYVSNSVCVMITSIPFIIRSEQSIIISAIYHHRAIMIA